MKLEFRFHDFFQKFPWLKFNFTVCLENVRVLFGSSDVPGLDHQTTDFLIGHSVAAPLCSIYLASMFAIGNYFEGFSPLCSNFFTLFLKRAGGNFSIKYLAH